MKKVVYNVVYQPQISFIHSDGSISKPELGFFEGKRDADLAISLLYGLERILGKTLCIKFSKDHSVEEKQILEGSNITIYRDLKEFAHKNSLMQYLAPKIGPMTLDRIVEDKIGVNNYMYNN